MITGITPPPQPPPPASANVTYRHHTYRLTFLHDHIRCPNAKSIAFPKSTSFPSLSPIKASFRNPNHETPKQHVTDIANPNSLSSFLQTTFITGVTVATLLLTRFTVKPSIAAPIFSPPPPATVETEDSMPEQQQEEKNLEERLCSHPEDANALKKLMEVKIKNGKIQEAIGILNQLINLEPEYSQWQLLKYHLHSYSGDHDSAKLGFEEILTKDTLRMGAYQGLAMAVSAKESPDELKDVEKKILEGMEKCKKGKKKDDLRDFKLLLAQIRALQGDYNDALKIYQELSKEEPRDFWPYLCQGIVYAVLGMNDDAQKNFKKYVRLVPEGHPFTR